MTVAYVIEPPIHRVKKLQRQAHRAEWSLVDLRYNRWCVQADQGGDDDKLARRLTRKYRTEVKQRSNCEIARFPTGRGYAVMLLQDTDAAALTSIQETMEIKQWTVVAPIGQSERPTVLCVSKWELDDIAPLTQALKDTGAGIDSIWEVGSCHPQ